MTVAADPTTLRYLRAATGDLGDRVGRLAGEVAEALAHVRATCVDGAPAVGPVDDELYALVASWRSAGDAAARFADDLEAADSSGLGDWLRGSGAVVLDRLLSDRRLGAVAGSLLEGDPTPDDVDVAVRWLQDHAGDPAIGTEIRSAALDLGRLVATGGVTQNAFTEWAMRGTGRPLTTATRVGLAYTAITDGLSMWDAVANHRSGAHKATAFSQTAFDASSAACAIAPNPGTCGATVVTGVVWGLAEAYEHRAGIRTAVDVTAQVARTEAGRLREAIEARIADGRESLGSLVDAVRTLPDRAPVLPLAPGLAPLASSVGQRMVDAGRSVAAGGRDFVDDRLDDARDAGKAVGHTIGSLASNLPGVG